MKRDSLGDCPLDNRPIQGDDVRLDYILGGLAGITRHLSLEQLADDHLPEALGRGLASGCVPHHTQEDRPHALAGDLVDGLIVELDRRGRRPHLRLLRGPDITGLVINQHLIYVVEDVEKTTAWKFLIVFHYAPL